MPVAVALGVEPGLPYVGGMPLPERADESHFLGAYFGAAGLPVAACWGVLESACHLRVVAVPGDWPARTGLSSRELAQRIGEVVFGAGKLAFGIPKLLVVEDDIDIADPLQVIWAFTSRAHPEHGEIQRAAEHSSDLPRDVRTTELPLDQNRVQLFGARDDSADLQVPIDLGVDPLNLTDLVQCGDELAQLLKCVMGVVIAPQARFVPVVAVRGDAAPRHRRPG